MRAMTPDIPVEKLTGHALDYAVGAARGLEMELPGELPAFYKRKRVVSCTPFDLIVDGKVIGTDYTRRDWAPTTDWAQGGPVLADLLKAGTWEVVQAIDNQVRVQNYDNESTPIGSNDWSTPKYSFADASVLVAACRAFVASCYGEHVEIPTELVTEEIVPPAPPAPPTREPDEPPLSANDSRRRCIEPECWNCMGSGWDPTTLRPCTVNDALPF